VSPITSSNADPVTQNEERGDDGPVRPEWVTTALQTEPVARLATTDADGAVRLVPICFAFLGDRLVSAVDHKPKRTARLRRLDDIAATGSATVLIDHYDDDWDRLWWVRVRGVATVHTDDEPVAADARRTLVDKYAQYRDRPPTGPVYSVRLDEVSWWRAQPEARAGRDRD
jgi:PPOX class probable F420-dependent enzyme